MRPSGRSSSRPPSSRRGRRPSSGRSRGAGSRGGPAPCPRSGPRSRRLFRVARCLAADRGAELGGAPDPRLRDPPPLLLGLGRLLPRLPLGVGSEGVHALLVPLVPFFVAAHCPHLFSILAPERSPQTPSGGLLREGAQQRDPLKELPWHRPEPNSRFPSATRSGRAPRGACAARASFPGVVYGQGGEARPFQVPARDLRTVLAEGPHPARSRARGSKAVPVVIKEQQHHPVRGDVLHLDSSRSASMRRSRRRSRSSSREPIRRPASARAACSSTSLARSR